MMNASLRVRGSFLGHPEPGLRVVVASYGSTGGDALRYISVRQVQSRKQSKISAYLLCYSCLRQNNCDLKSIP